MSVNALAPKFGNKEGYLAWRKSWRIVYRELSRRIRLRKDELRQLQRTNDPKAPQEQKELLLMRADALKMLTLLRDAKNRRDRILSMQKEIDSQPFPLEIQNCRTVDFHFNKGSLEYPFLPNWVVKAKGQSYYVRDVVSDAPFSTKNKTSGSTKGMLCFRKCNLVIDQEGVAHLTL